jgi:LPS sulfotransferase NodH
MGAKLRHAGKGRADGDEPTVSCLVAATPRSGSWLLCEAMTQSGVLGLPQEWFAPDQVPAWAEEVSVPPGADFAASYLSAVRRAGTDGTGVFAAKLHWWHLKWLLHVVRLVPSAAAATSTTVLDADAIAEHLPSPRYVLLTRRDRARQAVSYWRALETGVWWELEDEPPAAEPLVLDVQRVRWLEGAIADEEDRWQAYFRRHRIEPLELCYEDVVADRSAVVSQVAELLGVHLEPGFTLPPSRLRRQAGAQSEVWLSEYAERRSLLSARPG